VAAVSLLDFGDSAFKSYRSAEVQSQTDGGVFEQAGFRKRGQNAKARRFSLSAILVWVVGSPDRNLNPYCQLIGGHRRASYERWPRHAAQ